MARPHAVFIPHPSQSHIKTMLKLAKLLHHKGFHITFVNLESFHRRMLESRGPNSLDGLPDFRFEFIPDDLPPPETDFVQHLTALSEAIMEGHYMSSFKGLISRFSNTESSNIPPVTCIISDGFMSTFTIKAAEELGLPIAIFFTLSACGFMGFHQIPSLKERGLIPPKDIDFIPGMKNMRLRDFGTIFDTVNGDDTLYRVIVESTKTSLKAPAVIFHTFDSLEPELLDTLSTMYRSVHFIGPLELQLNQIQESTLSSIGCNLWKEEPECLQWLDSREPNSVLYVNFGSVTLLTREQLIEFGMGLAKSNRPFLWIITPDMVVGDSAILPPEFTEEIRERSFIASWCPQEEVLNHPSIGGFLTHSGWNSTIESISAGVPMLCWPFIGDQPTNCRYTCTEWGIGMEIENDVKRDGLAELAIELMEGEKGKKMKNRVIEWKRLAEEASSPNGSSSINLEKLVSESLQRQT
ncbi:hypothetical protein K2173_014984 [Erythroxylum novogranatense]|uniref:Glycosyltransferase n=1 Tax=Erythroxylum novogranatense TaxID=1862640 RepID=A0AAV8TV56_9ROSI|nr:hypothetical protein K2173_014984 [Erythroxylum novogranatense]